jgi:hypothetical protein
MIKFVVSVDFIDEVELDVVQLDVYIVVFGSLYIYMRDFLSSCKYPTSTTSSRKGNPSSSTCTNENKKFHC